MEENKLVAAVSLLVGVAIGVNWPKMKKYIPMAKDKVLEVYDSAKETVSDAAKTMKEKIAPQAVEVVKDKAAKVVKTARRGRATA